MSRALAGPILLALALRLLAIGLSDRVVADVERYEKVSRHLLDVSWNPYQTKRLYPVPAALGGGRGRGGMRWRGGASCPSRSPSSCPCSRPTC